MAAMQELPTKNLVCGQGLAVVLNRVDECVLWYFTRCTVLPLGGYCGYLGGGTVGICGWFCNIFVGMLSGIQSESAVQNLQLLHTRLMLLLFSLM
jgi:hypothetical protein